MSNFPVEIWTGFTLLWNKRQRWLKGNEKKTAPELIKTELRGRVVIILVRIRRAPSQSRISHLTNLSEVLREFPCPPMQLLGLYCILVGSRRLMPPDALQPKAYCTNHGLLAPPGVPTRDPSSERRNYLGEKWPMNFDWKCPTSTNIQGSFTCRKSTTWDKWLYFSSEGRRTEEFFRPEKSDVFGRVWTSELVYQRPARYL